MHSTLTGTIPLLTNLHSRADGTIYACAAKYCKGKYLELCFKTVIDILPCFHIHQRFKVKFNVPVIMNSSATKYYLLIVSSQDEKDNQYAAKWKP